MHNDVMANRAIGENSSVVRATVSLAHKMYDSLEEIAASKKFRLRGLSEMRWNSTSPHR
jgi:hypothetical protein